ncbi:hypothetical protein HDU76_012864 [Blyttiomyces sp. JEL0837]|nr:hypothetical protein HDU76_012864 [Blyttiomyces sp. JEL0837]
MVNRSYKDEKRIEIGETLENDNDTRVGMLSTSSEPSNPLPPQTNTFISLWDGLPPEIKALIFNNYSDLLTRHLNKQLPPVSNDSTETKSPTAEYVQSLEIWKIALDTNWEGNYNLLPYLGQNLLSTSAQNGGFASENISKETYHRLKEYNPVLGSTRLFKRYLEHEKFKGCWSWIDSQLFDESFINDLNPVPTWSPLPYLRLQQPPLGLPPPPSGYLFPPSSVNHSNGGSHLRPSTAEWPIVLEHANEFIANLLIHIPLRQYWLDLIPSWMVSDDVVKLKMIVTAGYHGHFKLFTSLVEELRQRASLSLACTLAFLGAASNGHTDIIKYLVEEAVRGDMAASATSETQVPGYFVKFSARENQAIRVASANGYLDIVKVLVYNRKCRPAAKEHDAIKEAARHGFTEIVTVLLLTYLQADFAEIGNIVLTIACEKGYEDIVDVVLEVVLFGNDGGGLGGDRSNGLDLEKGILCSAREGHVNVLKKLLKLDGVNPDNSPIIEAAKRGHVDVVKLLLKTNMFNPAAKDYAAILGAISNGHVDVVRVLLKCEGIYSTVCYKKCLVDAVRAGHIAVVECLLEVDGVDWHEDGYDSKPVRLAVKKGHSDMVTLFLDFKWADPTANGNELIQLASEFGLVDIVKLLLEIDGVDPGVCHSASLIAACSQGHDDVVKLLLDSGRVNPGANDNEAIRVASFEGFTRIVELLLRHVDDGSGTRVGGGFVDPTVRDNLALRRAAERGFVGIVKMLVGTKKVDVAAYDNEAFRVAAQNGHKTVVEFLLGVEGVEPWARGNEAFREAVVRGDVEMVKLLMAVKGVDAGAYDNMGIRLAAVNGDLKMMKVLFGPTSRDRGVDPAARDSEALRVAAAKGHLAIVELLCGTCCDCHYERVKDVEPGARNSEAFRLAAEGGYVDIVKFLMRVRGVDPFVFDSIALRNATKTSNMEIIEELLKIEGWSEPAKRTATRECEKVATEAVFILNGTSGF